MLTPSRCSRLTLQPLPCPPVATSAAIPWPCSGAQPLLLQCFATFAIPAASAGCQIMNAPRKASCGQFCMRLLTYCNWCTSPLLRTPQVVCRQLAGRPHSHCHILWLHFQRGPHRDHSLFFLLQRWLLVLRGVRGAVAHPPRKTCTCRRAQALCIARWRRPEAMHAACRTQPSHLPA